MHSDRITSRLHHDRLAMVISIQSTCRRESYGYTQYSQCKVRDGRERDLAQVVRLFCDPLAAPLDVDRLVPGTICVVSKLTSPKGTVLVPKTRTDIIACI